MADLRDDTRRCARQLALLAHPTRLAVLRLLAVGPQAVSDMQHSLAVEQSLLSHHLRALRKAGLVGSERRGRCVLYHANLSTSGAAVDHQGIDLGCCRLDFPLDH